MTLLEAAGSIAETALLNVWEHVSGPASEDADRDALQNQAKTICDLTAYSILCSAVGVERVESMKTASGEMDGIHPILPGSWTSADGNDYCHTYIKSDGPDRASEFPERFRDWAESNVNGVVQLKFEIGDAHTFAVEKTGGGLFRVYQSYQGKYSLEDFLNEVDANLSEFFLDAIHRDQRKEQIFRDTRSRLGSKKLCTLPDLFEKVIEPLCKGLQSADGIKTPAACGLSGVKVSNHQDTVPCGWIGALFFDGFDEADVASNLEALRSGDLARVTPWPTVHVSSIQDDA